MMRLITPLFVMILSFQLVTGQSTFSRAETQYEMQAYKAALKSYMECYRENPAYIQCAEGVAMCYARLNDFMHAAQWYEKIIDHTEVSPDVIFAYARTLKALKLYGKAKFYFERYAAFDAETGEHFAASCDFAINRVEAKPAFRITNAYFNTSDHDFGLATWNDKLVFTSFRKDIPKTRRTAETSLAAGAGSDLYLIDPHVEANVRLLFDDIADHAQVGPVHFSADGKSVALTKNTVNEESKFFVPAENRMSLYLATVGDHGKWEKVRPYPFNDNSYSTGFPWLSEDGMIMFFASDMPGGYGGYDLYVSYLDNGKWTEPQNLGADINTPGNEIAPFKSAEHFYFSSDWHPGFGGQDIFRTKYANGEWAPVAHLGVGVNSPKDDIGFVFNEADKTGYFYSDRLAGRGKMDIYKAEANMREVEIVVEDRDVQAPVLDAQILFSETGLKLSTDDAGIATVLLSRDTKEEVTITAEGYHPITMKLKGVGDSNEVMRYQVYVDALEAGQSSELAVEVGRDQSEERIPAIANEPAEDLRESAHPVEEANEELAPPMKKVYVRQAPEMKYAIQVSAFSKGEYRPERYQSLNTVGQVYDYSENQMTKVRVGYFDTRAEASEAIPAVRGKGFRDAFVVEQMVFPGGQQAAGGQVSFDYADFKVRLATYAKPGHFDAGKVAKIGKLESYKKNDLTIMLIGGFHTLVEAREALEQAQLAGFPDACIVKDMGGVLEKIRNE